VAFLTGAGAQIFGDNPIDLGALVDIGAVGVGTPTATTFTVRNAAFGLQWTFTGSGFSGFVDGFPGAGTITGVQLTRPGSSVSITGTSLPVATAVSLLNANNFTGVYEIVFSSADTLSGTAFDDQLTGFAGNDSITGGAGSDGVSGGAGLDTLFGEAGDDRINGGADNDLIDGGDGGDYLLGGAGADTLTGGIGDDTLVRLAADGPGADVLDGGAGFDRAEFGVTGTAGVTVNTADLATATGVTFADGLVVRNVEGVVFAGGAGADTFIISGPTNFNGGGFSGGGGVDTFVANLGASTSALDFNAPGQFSVTTFLGYQITNDVEIFRITTGSGEDRLSGGGGADFLSSGAGNDEVLGGGGDDTVEGGAGADFLSGGFFDGAIAGTGNDSIRGGDGDDTIIGYDGVNRLFGDAGDDLIRASLGDTIDGGAGTDELAIDLAGVTSAIAFTLTGAGFSLAGATINASNIERLVELNSGSGDDRFSVSGLTSGFELRYGGGAGFDVFAGDFSSSTAQATANLAGFSFIGSPDFVSLSDFEAINVKTGSGDDFIDGGAGNDTLDGGAGNDRFNLQLGSDIINGGDGDDSVGGFGAGSTVNGGAGVDTVWLNSFDVTGDQLFDATTFSAGPFIFRGSTVSNFEVFNIFSGDGDDTFTANGLTASFTFNHGGGQDKVVVNLSGETETVFVGGFGLTTAGNLSVGYGDVEAVVVVTGSGDDNLSGGSFRTTFNVSSGAGADNLFGGVLADTLSGGGDDDDITGREGDDMLDGGAGADIVNGGDGADIVNGGDGDDTLSGGSGLDTLDGGAGVDFVDLSFFSAVNINLTNGTLITGGSIVNGAYAGGALEDRILGVENVVGSAFGDRIVAANAGSTIDGGDGGDRISGLNGRDTVFGYFGNDTIDGGGGEDFLDGSFDSDSILGGQSSDTVRGGDGRDTLDGGTGFDTIDYSDKGGGVNVNVINGVALTGGFINSAGFYQGGAQEDAIVNFENIIGSRFSDRLIAGSTSARIEGDSGDDFVFTFSGNDTLFGGLDRDFLSSGKSTDQLFGEQGDDTLNGGTGFDTLDGGDQQDTADYSDRTGGVNVDLRNGTAITGGTLGGSGNYSGGFTEDRLVSIENVFGSNFGDRLTGLSAGSNLEGRGGADRIIGVGGNDTLDGGAGNDTITGGGGADFFVFNGAFGADRITDFVGRLSGGTDVIVLGGLGPAFDSFGEAIAAGSQSGANVVFDFGGGNTITVLNATLSNLVASDFFFTT
jgi:Ca2+-binding RTX toxin-like protein